MCCPRYAPGQWLEMVRTSKGPRFRSRSRLDFHGNHLREHRHDEVSWRVRDVWSWLCQIKMACKGLGPIAHIPMTYMSAGVNYFDAESRHLQAPPHLAASLHTCKHLQDYRIVIKFCKAIGPGMHRISGAGVNHLHDESRHPQGPQPPANPPAW